MPKKNTKKINITTGATAIVKPQVQVIHALTATQWAGNPALQLELEAILNSQVLKLAFQTILFAAMPSAMPVTQLQPGVSAEAMALADSNRYHHRSGMAHTYRALHNLAKAKGAPQRDADWGQLLDEDE